MLLTTGAAMLGLSAFPLGWASADDKKKPKILYFTKSAGYMHSVVDRKGEPLAFSEKVLTALGEKNGFEVECSQDSAVFDADLGKYDLLAFYTSGNPLDGKQKQNLLNAVAAGLPFVGLHSTTDSFRLPDAEEIDPFTAMLGAEFVKHGAPQKAKMKIASPQFPGVDDLDESFELFDEWYYFKKFSKEIHVILRQETEGMLGEEYRRPPYPATWAKMSGKGRVFYTSMGHFEAVWEDKVFQTVLLGGIAWALGNAEADIKPNIEEVAPKVNG
jgi:type 1 glutamine amidotransferase